MSIVQCAKCRAHYEDGIPPIALSAAGHACPFEPVAVWPATRHPEPAQAQVSDIAELRARLAACEKALRHYVEDKWAPVADYSDNYWYQSGKAPWKHAEKALATPAAHPDVPVNLCHICGALVPVARSEAHCAGHAK